MWVTPWKVQCLPSSTNSKSERVSQTSKPYKYMPEPIEKIIISQDEYNDLIAAKTALDKLKAAGVDNWEGYEVAMEGEEEEDDDDEGEGEPSETVAKSEST